jgi:hypothetical protein
VNMGRREIVFSYSRRRSCSIQISASRMSLIYIHVLAVDNSIFFIWTLCEKRIWSVAQIGKYVSDMGFDALR